jgi:hypothetical protein
LFENEQAAMMNFARWKLLSEVLVSCMPWCIHVSFIMLCACDACYSACPNSSTV